MEEERNNNMKHDIEWSKVDQIEYDVDAYLKAVSIYKVVSHFASLSRTSKYTYVGSLNGYTIEVKTKSNICVVNSLDEYNPEQFILFVKGEDIDPTILIKEITGVDLDDYIKTLYYSNGDVVHLR